jgi:hypothetical protein
MNMRRKTAMGSQGRRKLFVYTCTIVAMVAYALPKLPQLHHGLDGSFAMLWIMFAALAVAANVYFLVGADRERSRMLEQREQTDDLLAQSQPPLVRRRSF